MSGGNKLEEASKFILGFLGFCGIFEFLESDDKFGDMVIWLDWGCVSQRESWLV